MCCIEIVARHELCFIKFDFFVVSLIELVACASFSSVLEIEYTRFSVGDIRTL